MSHSEICPVCGGAGKIKTYLDPLGFGYSTSGKTYTEKTCHGCQGKVKRMTAAVTLTGAAAVIHNK